MREDGGLVRPGEAIAYCNIGLLSPPGEPDSFPDEFLDMQAVLAPRVAGRLRHSELSSRGGFLDTSDHFQVWFADFAIGHLEEVDDRAALPGDRGELEIFIVAGRRNADLAEGRQAVLTGWFDRCRAWRVDGPGPVGTLLSLGICEMDGLLRGPKFAFLEMFEAVRGPAQVVYTAEEPLVPAARVLIEQNARTEAQMDAITDDLISYLVDHRAEPHEWIFAGALLRALKRKPLQDSHRVVGPGGLRGTGPADAILLSARSDEPSIPRHRTLDYRLPIHGFRIGRAGPNIVGWYNDRFERERRPVDQIAQDYRELLSILTPTAAGKRPEALVVNLMSSGGDDQTLSYEAFDPPLGETLSLVYAKDVNLMLSDLAHEAGVAVVDADALAAEMGGQRHLPDNVHSSGALQAELRNEVLHILRARGVPGFAPAIVS